MGEKSFAALIIICFFFMCQVCQRNDVPTLQNKSTTLTQQSTSLACFNLQSISGCAAFYFNVPLTHAIFCTPYSACVCVCVCVCMDRRRVCVCVYVYEACMLIMCVCVRV